MDVSVEIQRNSKKKKALKYKSNINHHKNPVPKCY